MILVTGCAGFVGFHFSNFLLNRGEKVIGLDNLNNYYDVKLKEARVDILKRQEGFTFCKVDLTDLKRMKEIFKKNNITRVVNLAAQAGVRYSIENPYAYVDSNLIGFVNIIECCRHFGVKHLVYASTSSVYGANTMQPFSEDQSVEHPLALYAATKKANELIAHSYSHLYNLPTTGLRFFTVYGPWGRPDMALFLFTKNILENRPINIFNHGNMVRDFTYVDDIVNGVAKALDNIASPDPLWDSDHPSPASSSAPYRIYNIGNNKPIQLMEYVNAVENALGKKASYNMMPMQAGDVPSTCADVSKLENDFKYKPTTAIEKGVGEFVKWYLAYYKD